jgi:hypothetical protein
VILLISFDIWNFQIKNKEEHKSSHSWRSFFFQRKNGKNFKKFLSAWSDHFLLSNFSHKYSGQLFWMVLKYIHTKNFTNDDMKDFWNFNIQLSVFKVWINQKLNQWKKCQLQMIKMECCSRLMFIFMSQLPHVQVTNWKKHLKFKNQHLSFKLWQSFSRNFICCFHEVWLEYTKIK